MLFLKRVFFINLQPQIIDSLLAIARFFVNLIIFIVGSRPSIPDIALIVKNTFFFYHSFFATIHEH